MARRRQGCGGASCHRVAGKLLGAGDGATDGVEGIDGVGEGVGESGKVDGAGVSEVGGDGVSGGTEEVVTSGVVVGDVSTGVEDVDGVAVVVDGDGGSDVVVSSGMVVVVVTTTVVVVGAAVVVVVG